MSARTLRQMSTTDLYATDPGPVKLEDCYFYHTMEVPGAGLRRGAWDLRSNLHSYLGKLDFSGKRVLEMGTADGAICYHLEKLGAEVVAYDLGPQTPWDLVPYADLDNETYDAECRDCVWRLNNAWWYLHQQLGSRARVVYGSAYQIPEAIGPVDVCTFGAILLHLQNPFLALQNALRLTRESVVVTDLLSMDHVIGWPVRRLRMWLAGLPLVPRALRMQLAALPMSFLPNPRTHLPRNGWWSLSPEAIQRVLNILGFERTTVGYHLQRHDGSARPGRRVPWFTVVGHRTRPL